MVKRKQFAKYLLFGLILLYVNQWRQIHVLVSSFTSQKAPITIIQDRKLQDLIFQKTDMVINSVKIAESHKLFGMMIGIPRYPQLILSRGLYQNFTPEELEYVLLHEAGHYQLGHGLKELVIGVSLFILGCVILKKITKTPNQFITAGILGLAFGLVLIRVGKVSEYQADAYALARTSNPKGMITATQKFQEGYYDDYPSYGSPLAIFYRGVPYDERIKNAEAEIKRRSVE